MQVELFLNSVPILKKLSSDERKRVAGALEELVFDKGARVIGRRNSPARHRVFRPAIGQRIFYNLQWLRTSQIVAHNRNHDHRVGFAAATPSAH